MNNNDSALASNLQALDDLLLQERHAITHLRMRQLDAIQRQKIELLKHIQQAEQVVDGEASRLIASIKRNNDRNRALLASGLHVIGRIQDNVFRRLAITYAAHGRALNIGVGSRVLSRSV